MSVNTASTSSSALKEIGLAESEILPNFLQGSLKQHNETVELGKKMHMDINFGVGRTPGRPRKPTTKQMEAMIQTPFSDKAKGHIQNETMAIAIMQGQHQFSTDLDDEMNQMLYRSGDDAMQSLTSPIKKNKGGSNRHQKGRNDRVNGKYMPKMRYEKRSFLGVESDSMEIPVEVPRQQWTASIEKRKQDDGRSKVYTWAGKVLTSVPPGVDPFPKVRPSTVETKFRKEQMTSSLANAAKLYKNQDLQRSVQHAKLAKTVAMEEKAARKANGGKKKEILHKFAEFRKRLRMRLEERRDPMITYIMRCIDDSMILHFVEKYKGNNVTVDAIIDVLVTSVGAGAKDAPIDGEDIVPHMRHRTGWVPVTGPYSPEGLVHTLVKATPGFQPEVGMSLGARLNMNPDPQATFALDDQDIAVVTEGLSKYGKWGLRAGTANHIPLSRAQGWGPLAATAAPDYKPPFGSRGKMNAYTVGSGFRGPFTPTKQRFPYPDDPDGSAAVGNPSYHSFDDSLEMSKSVATLSMGHNPLSSPPAGYLADMAVTFPHDDPMDIFRNEAQGGNDETKEIEPGVAIGHVKTQLLHEGNLPSTQPLRALSDKQIELIGTGQETFDDIATSMDLAKKYGMKATGVEADDEPAKKSLSDPKRRFSDLDHLKLEGSVASSDSKDRRTSVNGPVKAVPPPRVVDKAHHGIGTPIETPSGNSAPLALVTIDDKLRKGPRMPYALGDELGKIMCSGVASGAGLPRPLRSNVRPNTRSATIGSVKGVLRSKRK